MRSVAWRGSKRDYMKNAVSATTRLLRERTLLFFAALTLFIVIEYVALGPSSFVRVHDEGDAYIGRNISIAHNIDRWTGNYWDPYVACGTDRLANDIRLNHLTTAIYYILPGWLAYQLAIFICYFTALYFTFRLCTDILELAPEAGLMAALSFAVYLDNLTFYFPYAAFPATLWLLEKIMAARPAPRIPVIVAFALVYSLASSLPLSIPFCLFIILVWFVFVRKRTAFIDLAALALFCAACVAPHVPVGLAILANNADSHRAAWEIWSMRESLVAQAVELSSIIFNNPVSLILACAGVFIYKIRNRNFLWCIALVLFCTIGVACIKTVQSAWEPLSFLNSVKLFRFYLLYPLFISLAAAFSVDHMMSIYSEPQSGVPSTKYIKPIIIGAAAFFILVNCAYKAEYLRLWMNGSFRTNYMNKTLAALSKEHQDEIFRVATVFDEPGFASTYDFETADGYVAFYQNRYKKFWEKVIEPSMALDPSTNDYFRKFGSRVYLFEPKTMEFSHKDTVEFNKLFRLDLLSLANTRFVFSRRRLSHPSLAELPGNNLKWYGIDDRIKRILARVMEENIKGENRLFIYENKDYLPRFFIANEVKVFETSDALLDSMALADVDALKSTVLVEKEFSELLPTTPEADEREVKVVNYEFDEIELEVQSGEAATLVATNSYSKFWKCFIDGKETPMVPAYETFWAVHAPRSDGPLKVVFKYLPPYGKN